MRSRHLILLTAFFLYGCGTTAKFVYPARMQNLQQLYNKPKYNLKVAVLPFEELRPDVNSLGGYFLYLIPLVPYGTMKYDRPDAARFFNSVREFDFNVSEDIAKAVVTSLRRSGLFKDVFFTYGGDKSEADLIVKGEILSTRYVGKIYSYGLSVYGPVLSLLGLPLGSSYNELSLRIFLNRNGSDDYLWGYEFNKEKTILQGLYYKMGYDVKSYAVLMEEGMNEAVESLDKKLTALYGR